jgi:pSer/pThr/pTyr-binding forkhead associated (FHA) protein
MASVKLKAIEGPDKGLEFQIDQPEVVLGRGEDCDVLLTDLQASRTHAKILQDGDDYFLCDLGSTNGTFLNGVKIRERLLVNGDRIRIGNNIFLLEVTED